MTRRMNALHNCTNRFQGKTKKVLAVCSAGLLRSPTIAHFLVKDYDFNVRIAGTQDYALVPVDEVLLTWADEIVCADDRHTIDVVCMMHELQVADKPVHCLSIPDEYEYMNQDLVQIVRSRLKDIYGDK